ncbi:hypothetical protein KI387_034681, partial [Taxus chinensis]
MILMKFFNIDEIFQYWLDEVDGKVKNVGTTDTKVISWTCGDENDNREQEKADLRQLDIVKIEHEPLDKQEDENFGITNEEYKMDIECLVTENIMRPKETCIFFVITFVCAGIRKDNLKVIRVKMNNKEKWKRIKENGKLEKPTWDPGGTEEYKGSESKKIRMKINYENEDISKRTNHMHGFSSPPWEYDAGASLKKQSRVKFKFFDISVCYAQDLR